LSTGTNSGAAANDHFSGIWNIIGSAYADTFFAGATSSSFVDSGTKDVVSYASDTVDSTLVIDQTTGGHSTGYAHGDYFNGIASIVGNSGTDTFIGGTASGSATMVSGTGTDWIDYQYATSAATVNLSSGTNSGAAANDHLSGIWNIIGSAYADTFFAGASPSSFVDSGTKDVVSYASDTVDSTLVIDQTTGGHGTGYAHGDYFSGIASIVGNSGTDTFIGGTSSGSATMVSGTGTDWIDYQYATSAATVNLSTGTNSGAATNDHLSGIWNIIGSAYADTFFAGATSSSFVDSGTKDVVSYTSDTVDSTLVIDQTTGGHGTGYAHGDYFSGIASIVGNSGTDTFIGGTASGSATMVSGTGTDWIDYQYATSAATVNLNTHTTGGAAQYDKLVNIENIIGSTHGNVLTGDAANNSFVLSSGGNTIDGGAGVNTIDYSGSTVGVSVFLGGIDASGHNAAYDSVTIPTGYVGYGLVGTATGDFYVNIENIIGSALGNDVLIGDANSNTLTGGAGNNTIFGSGGGDYLNGGVGGTNTLSYALESVGVTIYLGGTDQTGNAHGVSLATGYSGYASNNGHIDYLANFHTVIGSTGNDFIVGNGTSTVFNGDGGNDTIYGMAGNNSFIAGHGSEYIDGGTGVNRVDYGTANGGVTVDLATHSASGTGFTDTLYNIENIVGSNAGANVLIGDSNTNVIWGGSAGNTIHGGSGTDTIYGGGGSETIYGGSGTDTIYGGSGTDTIYGGSGSDTIYGGSGSETFIGGQSTNETLYGGTGSNVVDYSAASGGVTVNLASGTGTNGTFHDHLYGIENVVGSANGTNVITGDSNADIITCGTAADTLLGGGGNDTFNVSATQLASFTGTIDGGTGSSTLVSPGGNVQAAASHIADIQAVDVHNGSSGVTYNLSATDIQHIVGANTASDLTFTMDSGDSFNAQTSTGITVNTTVHSSTYTHYDFVQAGLTIAKIEVHTV
jgi:Ca2+-binding RTX toxin-like protein